MNPAAFVFIDTATGGVFKRNHVVAIDKFEPSCAAQDCFTTLLRFTDDLIDYMQTHRNKNGSPSVAGYPGPGLALFVPFDFDCEENPAIALADARKVARRWMADYQVPANAIRVFFSGYKGFSIELPATLFGGFEPSVG